MLSSLLQLVYASNRHQIVSHSAFCSGALAHGPAMLMHPPFRFLQFASYTFDASLVEILTTLLVGGTICVPHEDDRTNGNISAVMEKMGATMTLLTPSFARVLKPESVPSLKTLILGGEAMTSSHLATWSGKVNLVNAYGPSECAVVAAVKSDMTLSTNPGNLGRGLGRCWVVDPKNHDRLAPIGSVGELVIESPTLSAGYLRNDIKTEEVFVWDPKWTRDGLLQYDPADTQDKPTSRRRMYKTGDLVKICDGGTGEMAYVGRKDNSQAKLNGQRLELDEIAHHLGADESVRHAVVVFPTKGSSMKKIVAVVSLHEITSPSGQTADLEVVISKIVAFSLSKIRDRLRDRLPPYMMPSTWIPVRAIPLLPSGKLDRAGVARFVETVSDETVDELSHAMEGDHDDPIVEVQEVPLDEKLKTIWSQVLNISPARINKNVSFLHLGGDSITAMQVMGRCRDQDITVSVPDVIGSKSVHDLALKARVVTTQKQHSPDVTSVAFWKEDDHEFDASPIQQLYFQLIAESSNASAKGPNVGMQFNQSILLRVSQSNGTIGPHELSRGLHAIVETHSMLRARFRQDRAGSWRQRITSDVSGSYRFKIHTISSTEKMEKRIQLSQGSIDVHKGPLVVADWFTIRDKTQTDPDQAYIFIAIHHLVVDVVSWGILLHDLEEFFHTGKIRPLPVQSIPFQAWTRKQAQQAHAETNCHGLLPHHEAVGVDMNYWGITPETPNLQGDAVAMTECVELDPATTALLLGPECQAALGTDTLDILLGALLLSYRNSTSTRGRKGVPTIYNEGHGREGWDNDMDVSRTIGWFTTLYPIHLPDESSMGMFHFHSLPL